MGYTSVLAN